MAKKTTQTLPDFDRFYCVVKRSAFEYYNSDALLAKKYSEMDVALKQKIEQNHANHHKLLDVFRQLCSELSLSIILIPESEINQKSLGKKDLVFSFGGDGTFLQCANQFTQSLIVGINSDYRRFNSGKGSRGALTSLNFINLRQGLKEVLAGKARLEEWHRLEVTLNGRKLDRFAVNDVYVGSKIAYKTSDITIKINKQTETFLSSGVVCCTGMGSHAWFNAAGGSPFSNGIYAFGFIVLYPNTKKKHLYTSGILSGENKIVIIPNRPGYVINFDSRDDEIQIEMGDQISVSLSQSLPVRVLVPNKDMR